MSNEKVLKIIWIVLAGVIFIWNLFFYVWMKTSDDFGVFLAAIFFGIGLYALLIFVAITFLYLLIKWIIKWIKKKSSKQGKSRKK